MSIPIECMCGKMVWAPPTAANLTTLCSRCGTVLRVPVPEIETGWDIPILAGPPIAPRPAAADPASRTPLARRA